MTAEQSKKQQPQNLTELFNIARENLKAKGMDRPVPSSSNYQAAAQLQRRLLDSIFVEPRYLDPVEPNTGLTLFGTRMNTPVFCSALSKPGNQLTDEEMGELVRGMGRGGGMMMLGMGGSDMLQRAIDTGTPVVKIVKPYRTADLIFEQMDDAAKRGCVAVGMDIDHFYGSFRDGSGRMADIFAPHKTDEMRQVIAATKLPFIVKGVLSVEDARKSIDIGASAIIVSNHMWSGHVFSSPSIMSLSKIVKAAGSKITVLVDSGFRTGDDVFKALALGAKAVGFTTSVVAAASAGGASGVEQLMGFITAELKRTMATCGCAELSSIDSSRIALSPELKQWW
jgi:4-hydroxymandelate oxidase